MVRVLVVEDEANIREMIALNLRLTGMEAVEAESAEAALPLLAKKPGCDAAILDVMLPDEDGYQILGKLRENAATRNVPVIMVTAKTSEIDVVKGLDKGADDYLCKPFGIMEFISRVKAVLRRAQSTASAPSALRFGTIALDDLTRTVTVEGEPVELPFKEYALLHFFLEHPEEVLARERIMKAVNEVFDLRPAAIVRDLDLLRPIYRATSSSGHCGRPGFSWEATDRVEALRQAV